MTDLTDQLDRMIQKAALDGALTNDAVKQFHTLVQENSNLKEQLEKRTEQNEQDAKVLAAVQKERDDARLVRDELLKRQDDLTAREEKITILEEKAKWQETRVNDHKHVLETIFKPGTVRREMWGSIPGFDHQGYPAGTQGNKSESTTDHDE